MPATYAHNRFGADVVCALPSEIASAVLDHRDLFDVGLHGPDFFFFADFLGKPGLSDLGRTYHRAPARKLFESIVRQLRQKPDPEGIAYLFGLLGHFCLDARCHPRVRELNDRGAVRHTPLETEFDRYLMTLDGIAHPEATHTAHRIRLTHQQSALVARFYPPAAGKDVAGCVFRMRLVCNALVRSNPVKSAVVSLAQMLGGQKARDMVMTDTPRPEALPHLGELLALYEKALEDYPVLARALCDHLYRSVPLPPEFDRDFG